MLALAMTDTQIVLLLLPVILIELGLIVFALRDLLRPERRCAATASSCGG